MSDIQQSQSEATVSNEPVAAPLASPEVQPSTNEASSAVTNVESNFLDSISEDLRGEASLKDFKDINSLAKSYVNAQRMIGNSVRLPNEDSSPEARQDFLNKLKDVEGIYIKPSSEEEWSSFYNKLGRPEAAEGYDFSEVIQGKQIHGLENLSPEVEDFKSIAHEIGLTDKQAKQLVDMRLKSLEAQQATLESNRDASEKALKDLWGQDYDNRLKAAKQVAKLMSEKHPDHMNELINGPTGNNPVFLNMLAELGHSYKEKGHTGMQNNTFGMTPEQANHKIAEKRADRGFMQAYMDPMSPGHKKAVEDMTKLYELANS